MLCSVQTMTAVVLFWRALYCPASAACKSEAFGARCDICSFGAGHDSYSSVLKGCVMWHLVQIMVDVAVSWRAVFCGIW